MLIYERHFVKAKNLLLIACFACLGCAQRHIESIHPVTVAAVTPTPVQDAYYRRFPPPGKGPYLEEPRSCDSLLSYDGTLHEMPDAMQKRIADGKGFPEEYYRSHRVPAIYCRPANHVWTFPESGENFFDTVPVTYRAQHLSDAEIQTIERIKRGLPVSDRASLKWTKTGSSLYVFRLQPWLAARDYFGYRPLNSTNSFIDPNTGDDILLPGP
jgi:hypothetical protein